MKVLGFDAETTGLSLTEDRITEVGAVLWDTDTKAPLQLYSEFVYESMMDARFTAETEAMMLRVSKTTVATVKEFGISPWRAFGNVAALARHADFIVAHNGNQYDKPLLFNELDRMGAHTGVDTSILRVTPWIDTKTDLPHTTPPDSNRLKHLALEMGFINPFPHRAVTDVLTMLKVLSEFPIMDVVALSKIPTIIVRAMVPQPWDDAGKGKDFAKANAYRWQEANYRIFEKCWVKVIRENQLEAERVKMAGYEVVVLAGAGA